MAKYDHTTPQDVLKAIEQKKKKGYFVQRLNDKKQLAQYYEVILKDKKKANETYEDLRSDLKKELPKCSGVSSKEMAKFLRELQDRETGSFVEHPTIFSLEIERAKHILRNLKKEGLKPKFPLKFLKKVDTGKKLKNYFRSLLYDFSKNNEDELNLVITGLPAIKETGFHSFSKDWEKAYYECLEMWQNPNTGYWGPWMKKGNKVIKIPELSTTFHIIRIYYDKDTLRLKNPDHDLKYKKRIIKTTWDIRNKDYPYGWLEKRNWSTHHLFDVAEIFLYLFKEMTLPERKCVRRLFDRILRWCIKNNLQENGGFIGHYFPRVKEPSIYLTHLAVLLLRAIGYFSGMYRGRIWSEVTLPINSYRVYHGKIPSDTFDTKNLDSIIYKKRTTLDPLDARQRIFKFWCKNRHKDPSTAINTDSILKFTQFPPKEVKILHRLPKLKRNERLVAVDRYGGVVWVK